MPEFKVFGEAWETDAVEDADGKEVFLDRAVWQRRDPTS